MAAAAAVDPEVSKALEPTVQDILDSHIRWVFVGGKGGVGKTTTSCALGVLLAGVRERVLIVSTDPAHNLSDAFGQQFGPTPIKVKGFDNLFCVEPDASRLAQEVTDNMRNMAGGGGGAAAAAAPAGPSSADKSMIGNLLSVVPGMDELGSFMQVFQVAEDDSYSVVVFDTAPTGHTLKLLAAPESFSNLLGSPLLSMASSLFGAQAGGSASAIEDMRHNLKQVADRLKDPTYATFVCVCIPEFLAVYETERLVQELTRLGIFADHVVVNNVLLPDATSDACAKCRTRKAMQDKYLSQIATLYGEDFHVILTPLLDAEVRGVPALKAFGKYLTATGK